MAFTEKYTGDIRLRGGAGPIRVIEGSAPAATDTTVYTPSTGNMCLVVGIRFSEGTASNVTFKSGSDTLELLELAANQGLSERVDGGVVMFTEASEALVVNPSAEISSMTFYIVETKEFIF